MPSAPPRLPDPQRIVAALGELRGWLLGLLVWLAETIAAQSGLGRALRRQARSALRKAGRDARMLILLRALQQLEWPAPTTRPVRAPNHPRGFRRVVRRHALRIFTARLACGLNRGALRKRAARLRGLLEHAEALAARLAKRVRGGVCRTCLIAAAPPAIVSGAAAPAGPNAVADTS